MITNATIRRPEHLHSVRCLSSALISAIENFRDTDHMTDLEFRLHAQDGTFVHCADEYLNSGTATCICPPCNCCPA
jgi:hypothetical protein